MALYRYKCKECGVEIRKNEDRKTKFIDCKCGAEMKRQIPMLGGAPKVTEVIDQYTNTKHIQNQAAIVEERRDKHYWTVEVPRLVQTHDMKTCLEMGWIVLDEKGKPVIQTTPPNKR